MNQGLPLRPRVLVIGNGAREHTIVWKLAQSTHQPQIYVAPGNPGMQDVATLVAIGVDEGPRLVRFAVENDIHLVVPGPEAPLADGIADAFVEAGIPVFGPLRAAAQLESSKAFAKSVMQAAAVPTAAYAEFTDVTAAKQYIEAHGAPIVVKADGLAAGKGVTVATTVAQGLAAVEEAMVGQRFGLSGSRVVIEDCLTGAEVSLMFIVSGDTVLPLLPARDHKRVFTGDLGPNTGGMGAFAPVTPFMDAGLIGVVEDTIVRPTLAELNRRGIPYQGVLYVGLMLTPTGPQVIEFNCRFGDPETEVVLPLLETDLLDVVWASAHAALGSVRLAWRPGAAVCVVCAADGYPTKPRLGDAIALPTYDGAHAAIFHAGTKQAADGTLCTAGGRVLAISGWADDFEQARRIAYALADAVHFDGKHLRTDIATNPLQ